MEHNFREQDKIKISQILIKNGYKIIFKQYSWLTKGDIWAVLDL